MTRPTFPLAVVACLLASACSGPSSRAVDCSESLPTVDAGTLTLATNPLTVAPWVVGGDKTRTGDPRDGNGYDASVGFALADELGFDRERVRWVSRPFTDVAKGRASGYDIDINQASVTAERRALVDLVHPYYTVRQAVVTTETRAKNLGQGLVGLKRARFGVVSGSDGARALDEVLSPSSQPITYATMAQAVSALRDLVVDALVVDYNTALRLDQDESVLVEGTVVGLLPVSPGQKEVYGLVLPKASALTPCVDKALGRLRADGTLTRLEQTWLIDQPGYRVLR